MSKNLHNISLLIAVLVVVTTGFGLLDFGNGEVRIFQNIYGDAVRIFGKGLYKNDALFFAPIFKGTDFTMLVLGVPSLLFAVFYDKKKQNQLSGLLLVALLALILYYSASIVFGVFYNMLFLVYVALFSLSLFALIMGMSNLQSRFATDFTSVKLTLGLKIFLILGGISLFVAWLPDIIQSYFDGKLSLQEVYHTQVTYILDMGVISPMLFVCLHLMRKNQFMGVQLVAIFLVCILFISIMLPIQTLFQLKYGIEIPPVQLITKVGIFVALGAYALILIYQLFLKRKENK